MLQSVGEELLLGTGLQPLNQRLLNIGPTTHTQGTSFDVLIQVCKLVKKIKRRLWRVGSNFFPLPMYSSFRTPVPQEILRLPLRFVFLCRGDPSEVANGYEGLVNNRHH